MSIRDKIRSLIREKIDVDDKIIEDVEKGIYNYSLDYADDHHLIKNWKNPLFKKIYIEKARSIISNIDPTSYINNPCLLKKIKDQDIAAKDVCYMKPEEVCPDKWRDVITKHMKKFEYAYEAKEVATTSHFKCSKCKKREVTYVEVQLRAGDEGSTLLFTCQSCGHKWRM